MRNRFNALTVLTPVLAVGGCLVAASPVFAQQVRPGETMGLRYLSWSGKAAAPTPGDDVGDGLRRSAGTPAPTLLAATATRYPGIQPSGARPSRYGVGSGAGLTPAGAWTGSGRTPAPAPTPLATAAQAPASRGPVPAYSASQAASATQAQAESQAQIQAQYQAWYQSEAQAQYEAQVRAMPQQQQPAVRMQAPVQQAQQPQQNQQQPQYQQQADAGPTPGPTPGYDPMAPRRDAPIFRMQQPQAASQPQQQSQTAPTQGASTQADAQGEIQSSVLTQPVAGRTPGGQAYAGAEPPREGVRYYSVQRAVGRQPDPIAMPESVYLDNAPIDLAEPPAAPVRTRTVNGQAQVVVPNQDPNLP